MVQVIDRILERSAETVVVLGHDEDESIGVLYQGTPVPGVLVEILAKARMIRLVHKRKVEFREIHDLDIEAAVLFGTLTEPLSDRLSDAAGTRTGDQDHEFRFGHGTALLDYFWIRHGNASCHSLQFSSKLCTSSACLIGLQPGGGVLLSSSISVPSYSSRLPATRISFAHSQCVLTGKKEDSRV